MAAPPLDIITDILSRLPVKLLLRFKSVSKSWYFLIKSPHFTKLHLTQTLTSSTHRHVIACYSSLSSAHLDDDDENPTHLSFSELYHPLKNSEDVGFKFLGSCNGIVLIILSQTKDVVLLNPCTKSHRELPYLKTPIHNNLVTLYSVGYDNVSDDYKVFKVVQFVFPSRIEMNVYSLRRNSWKHVDDVLSYVLYDVDCCVSVDQGIHNLVYDMELKKHKIIRFDIVEESYSVIEFPDFKDGVGWFISFSLGDLGGSLCLLVHLDREKVDCWVMKEYGKRKRESWTRLFSVCTGDVIGMFNNISSIAKSKDGRSILLNVDERKLYWCDLKAKTKKVERVQTQGLPKKKENMSVGVYVESLVSLDEEEVLASEHHVQREGGSMATEIDK